MVLAQRVVNPHAPSSSDGRSLRGLPRTGTGPQGQKSSISELLQVAGPDRSRVSGPGVPGSLRVRGVGGGEDG